MMKEQFLNNGCIRRRNDSLYSFNKSVSLIVKLHGTTVSPRYTAIKHCEFMSANITFRFPDRLIISISFWEAASRYGSRVKWINETRSLECHSQELWRPGSSISRRRRLSISWSRRRRSRSTFISIHLFPSSVIPTCVPVSTRNPRGFITRSNWPRSVSLRSGFDRSQLGIRRG